MQAASVSLAVDRSMLVPKGEVVHTGYVDVFRCRLACRERMAVGDIAGAYGKRLQLGDANAWPCPRGQWEDDHFVIIDGRHEWVAAVMLGHTHLLVAWIAPPREA